MTKLAWHSVTYDGDVPIQEDIAFDDGYVFNFNIGDWYVFRGRRVYVGEHLRCKSPVHLQDILRSYEALAEHLKTCAEPHHATQHMDVRYNALRN